MFDSHYAAGPLAETGNRLDSYRGMVFLRYYYGLKEDLISNCPKCPSVFSLQVLRLTMVNLSRTSSNCSTSMPKSWNAYEWRILGNLNTRPDMHWTRGKTL